MGSVWQDCLGKRAARVDLLAESDRIAALVAFQPLREQTVRISERFSQFTVCGSCGSCGSCGVQLLRQSWSAAYRADVRRADVTTCGSGWRATWDERIQCAHGEHFGDDRPCIRETRRRGYGQSPRPPPPGGLRSSTVTSKIFCEFSRLALRAQARGFHQSQHDAVERTHDQPARPGVLCAQPFRLCPCEHCRHPHDGRRAQRAQQEMKSPAESGAVCRQRSPGTSQRQRGKSVFIGAGSSAELRSPRRTFSFGTPHSGRELSERRRSVAAHSHEPNGEGQ